MSLPIPESIDIEGDSVATIWPAWRVNWGHYYITSEIYTKKISNANINSVDDIRHQCP